MRHMIMWVAVVAGAPVAMAQVDIRMDLATSVSSTGGNWNDIANLTGMTPNLKDFTTGAPTGISIDGAGSPWQAFFGDDAGAFPNKDWLIQPATRDGAGLQAGTTGIFRIGGLSDSTAYRVEVVSARSNFNYLNTFTVDGAIADRTVNGTAVVTPWNSTTDGLAAGNWLIWDDVFPTRGQISIMDVAGPGTLGIMNAIRISAVPTPGTGLVLAIGAGALARRRA